jgi:glucose-6-phosphate 1-dehydrogenase
MSDTQHAGKKEAKSQMVADINRQKLEKVHEMVDSVLKEMQSDNPPDPIHSLMEKVTRHAVGQSGPTTLTRKEIEPKYPAELAERPLSIVVFGASGDLAKKKTFSGLFNLYRNGFLPAHLSVVGYARSDMSVDDIKEAAAKKMPKNAETDINDFFEQVSYVRGQYDEKKDFEKLAAHLKKEEDKLRKDCKGGKDGANRIFYLAVPPDVFNDVAKQVKDALMETGGGFVRVLVEKPFGHDTASCKELTANLLKLFKEEQICRIDHYFGKEVLRSIFTLRFANHLFSTVWNRDHIDNIQIYFKETEGIKGRGGYYDKFGVIRDVMQNHMVQILVMLAMEKPKALDADGMRDARAALLKCVKPIDADDCVLGQYTAPPDGSEKTYLEEDGVAENSKTPTFAAFPLYIDNDRWRGVPFVIKSGKALNEKAAVIRVQFKEEEFDGVQRRNELVFRIQPDDAMYMTVYMKGPGMDGDGEVITTEFDLTYKERYDAVRIPEAYEPLMYEAIIGDMRYCVRSDELNAAWEIFTPLLEELERRGVTPTPYPMGSRGPKEAEELAERSGYQRIKDYEWRKQASRADEKKDEQRRAEEEKLGQRNATEKAQG